MLNYYVPNEHHKDIYQINLSKLKEQGKKGLIVDLDNTLISWDKPYATEELKKWLQEVADHGFKITIASNNNARRIGEFAHPLDMTFVARAKKPLAAGFKKALAQLHVPADQVVMVGDQLMTDIYGGNKMGLYTILVDPIVQTDGFFTRFNRMREKRIFRKLQAAGLDWRK